MNSRSSLFAILTLPALLASCAGPRFAQKGEQLYTGAEVIVDASEKTVDKKAVAATAREAIRAKPNSSFLGLYPGLAFHSLVPDSVRHGFRAWLKRKLGETPVYVSDVDPAATAKTIDAGLFNAGMFDAATTFSLAGKGYAAKVVYHCAVRPPFMIRSLGFPHAADSLSAAVAALAPSSIVKIGGPYDLSKLRLECGRIDSVLKENGYFYFNADNLLFTADTNSRARTVDLTLSFKDDLPAESHIAYRVRSITIDPSYSLGRELAAAAPDTATVDSILFTGRSQIKPSILARACAFKRNRLYSTRQHQRTLNRLMSMGNFRYAAIQYTGSDSAGTGLLDVKILLTPLEQQSVRSELTMVSKSNDFVGPKLDLNYTNRNALGGAEFFNLTMSSSAETQFVGPNAGLFSYELNPQADFTVPRFMVPFILQTPRGAYVPKTKISSGYSFVRRVGYFDSKSLLLTYGFSWRQSQKTAHELNPVNIDYMALSNKSKVFDSLLDTKSYLKRSYQEQFIAGSSYSYTYNEQIVTKQKNQFYFNGTGELAGNTIAAAQRLFTGKTVSADHPLTVAGSPYSQFARITLDARNITNYSPENKLVLRLYAGLGKAYGNSATLPYARQFFTGGPSSVRAFQINTVGPGTDTQNMRIAKTVYLASGGDLKLEANAEYRFPLIGFLKGATFVDAGNNWIWQRQEGIKTGVFAPDRFYKEIAVGTGAGLRLDLSFFIMRFDVGVPLRSPRQWVVDQVNVSKAVWNIAIGYPF